MAHRWWSGLLLLAVAVVVVLGPCPLVQAQRRHRGRVVQTPFGPMDTRSPEWRASGGNPNRYFALKMHQLQRKSMTQQYQAMQKQQQAFDRWYKEQKSKKEKGQKTDPAFDQFEEARKAEEAATAAAQSKAQARQDALKERLQKRRELIRKNQGTAANKPAVNDPAQPPAEPVEKAP